MSIPTLYVSQFDFDKENSVMSADASELQLGVGEWPRHIHIHSEKTGRTLMFERGQLLRETGEDEIGDVISATYSTMASQCAWSHLRIVIWND